MPLGPRDIVPAMRKLVPAAALAAVVVVGARGARADEPRATYAVGGIAIAGDADAPLAGALRTAATGGLTGTPAQVAPDVVARLLASVPDLATCTTADCLTRFAASSSATRVVALDVEIEGELYHLRVKVTDASGRAVRVREDECIACAVPEVQEKVSALVNGAVTAATDDVVAVEITTTPPGAELTIDGVARGRTPWRGELPAGPHQVVVRDDDGHALDDQLVVEAGGGGAIALTIPGAGPKPRRWGALRWVAAGTGGALAITGVVLLAKDGDGTCGQPSCPERWETTAGGIGLLSAGVVVGAAAGWMIWQDHRGAERPSFALLPTDGGLAAAVGGRF